MNVQMQFNQILHATVYSKPCVMLDCAMTRLGYVLLYMKFKKTFKTHVILCGIISKHIYSNALISFQNCNESELDCMLFKA